MKSIGEKIEITVQNLQSATHFKQPSLHDIRSFENDIIIDFE